MNSTPLGLSLTPEAYGEIRAKLIALGLKEVHIQEDKGLEFILMNDIVLIRDPGINPVKVYIAYDGKLLKEPKPGLPNG